MKQAGDQHLDRIIAVDWSGRIDKPGQRKHIWMACWSREGVTLEAGRTRDELCAHLADLSRETPRLVAGLDFAFSYPAWFLQELGVKSALDFWQHVAAGQGEHWLSSACEDVRFWGKPRKKPEEFRLQPARMLRGTDVETKCVEAIEETAQAERVRGIAPKSPFQIGGAGAVGTGSLRGIPYLLKLRAAGFRVWPFEQPRFPLVLEIYPRLLTGSVHKSNADARKRWLAERKKQDKRYARLSRDVLAKAEGSEDAFDALASAMEMAARADELLQLQQTTHPRHRLEGRIWQPE
ncbi:MAG: hypothetical protein ACYC46_01685 [Acidobacteriaceae bacterium]